MSNPKRPATYRLLVSETIPTQVDGVRVGLILKTEREWTKTQINDAIVQVALRHLDEVAAELLASAGQGA